MKTFRLFSLLLITALVSFNFSSCSSDDDNSSNESTSTNTSGYIQGHKYVDLGLSVKWATCNIGADSIYDCGDYYAWGETSTKTSYTSTNCSTYGEAMSDISGNSKYDAARANWGGTWRMPTNEEIEELINNCTWQSAVINYQAGALITGKNGNTIFLPSGGNINNKTTNLKDQRGCYWSSTPDEDNSYSLYSDYGAYSHSYPFTDTKYDRYLGMNIRPVSD